jgi:zinc/manganese transport system substrate-binding protein
MRRLKLILILLAVLTVSALTVRAQEPLRVVATFSILGDFAQNVGGDAIALSILVGPGGDSHTYEPTPQDAVTINGAQVVIENGFGFEAWFDELYEASESTAMRVVVSEGSEPLAFAGHENEGEEHHEDESMSTAEADHEGEGKEGEDHIDCEVHHDDEDHEGESMATAEAGHEDEHGECDPHIWQSVSNAVIMVNNIRNSLIAADPSNEALYNANADAYIAELTALDAFIQETVAQLPEEQRVLFTSHDTFGYFARDYGFTVEGSALGALSTEVADPSAGEIAALVGAIQVYGVKAIFAENVANADLMARIASEAGVTLAPTLYTDALGEAGSEGDTYLKMMRYNVTTIVTALQ